MSFPKPPEKIVPFNSGPVAAHDIGRQFDEHRRSSAQIIDFLKTVVRDDGRLKNGLIGPEQLDPKLPEILAERAVKAMTELLANVLDSASRAQASAAEVWRIQDRIEASRRDIAASADLMSRASQEVQMRLAQLDSEVEARVSALVPAGVLGPQKSNFYATDEQSSAPLSSDYAQVSIEWAEHMPDTIPPNVLAINAISGDHWSSRWWANRSANAFGMLAWWYQGAWPSPGPPSTPDTPTGDPLPPGSVYFDTTLGAMFVWNGSAWVPLVGSATVLTSATAPSGAIPGMLWFDSVAAQMYVWFNDGNSLQWVPVINQLEAGGGGPAPSPPVNVTPPTVTGTASVGQTLTVADNGAWTQSPSSFGYQWLRNGANILGATTSSYLLVSADSGTSVGCLVTAINGSGGTPALSNVVVPSTPPSPANTVAPAVTGTGVVGQVLTLSNNGTWINTPTSFTYQWLRGLTNISGATSSTYTLVSADALNAISCAVTATNASGSGSAASNSISVLPLAPANTVLPAILGTPTVRQTVSCTQGTWLNAPSSFGYQWLRNGVNISGATGSSYTLVLADGSQTVSCAVTAYNSGGGATATSSGVSVAPPFTLPAGASAIYSLRQVGPGYAITGPCVNVLRFSDGATMDISFDAATGLLDMAAATTFANGSMLYVMKWYDQSGNGHDATQTAPGAAPQLMNFNGPQVAFASLNTLKTAAAISLTGDQTIGLFLQDGSNAAGFPICCWDASHGWAVYLNGNGAGTISTIYDGSVGPADTSNLLAGSLHQVVLTKASGAVKIYADGAQTGSGSASATTGTSTNPVNIGSLQQNSFQFQGLISEVYLYPSALTPTQVAAINANEVATFPQTGFQNYYNGSCAVQPGAGNYLTFGNVLDYEYTQPWTMYAQVHMFSVGGGAEGGIGANIDHATGPTFKGYLVAALLSIGSPYIPGALSLRIISDLNANKHLQLAGAKSLCDGQPHLLAVTWDGSGVAAGFKAYIDGVQDTLTVIADALGGASIVGGTQNFSVGCQANDGGNAVNGRVGFFQMDNVVRSQSYIVTNFTLTTQPPNTANTVMRLMMSEGSGTTVHDTSASGFNGTLTSGGMWVP